MPAVQFALLAAFFWQTGSTDATLSQFKYTPASERDLELAATGTTTTKTLTDNWTSDRTRKLLCAGFCNADGNCTAFSYVGTAAAGFVCKIGAAKSNETQKLTGSKVFFKLIPTDGYSTTLNPFRYKVFNYKATSPADASQFCFSTDGSAIPVGYPSSEAFRTLQVFVSNALPKNSSIFVGVQLANVSSNGTWEFRTLRDWPAFVDPIMKDIKQPWAPNEPTKLAYSQPSDIGVMMNSNGAGWFTADTRSTESDAVVCMKHADYQFLNATRRFHRVDPAAKVTRAVAEGICQSEGGYLSRAYGQQGKDLISYVRAVKGAGNFWLAGTTGVASVTTLWKFPDGLVLDDSKRSLDSRQIWESSAAVATTNNNFCIKESNSLWWGAWCTDTLPYLCEGGF